MFRTLEARIHGGVNPAIMMRDECQGMLSAMQEINNEMDMKTEASDRSTHRLHKRLQSFLQGSRRVTRQTYPQQNEHRLERFGNVMRPCIEKKKKMMDKRLELGQERVVMLDILRKEMHIVKADIDKILQDAKRAAEEYNIARKAVLGK